MSEPSPEAKQAAEWSGEGCCIVLPNGAIICVKDKATAACLRGAHNTATAKLREELAQVRGDACKLLAFANLVEPYVSNDHCHGKSELDHKLYDACFEIRPLIAKWTRSYIEGEQLAHQQPNAEEEEYNKEAFVECDRCQIIGYDLRTQKCVSCGYSR